MKLMSYTNASIPFKAGIVAGSIVLTSMFKSLKSIPEILTFSSFVAIV